MAVLFPSKYTVEIWTRDGTLIVDLSGKVANKRFQQSRNQPDIIEFELDAREFEAYCRAAYINSTSALLTRSVEIRVKRNQTYFTGGQLVYKRLSVSGKQAVITIKGIGFLALFAKRRTGTGTVGNGTVSEVYTAANGNAKSRKDVAWELIRQSQLLVNGDFGVTRGLTGGSTTLYDKTFSRTEIMTALQDMTNLQTEPIDIEFTYNKVFNTYAKIGSMRTDIVFEYPGNILSFEVTDDGTDTTNEVIGLGAGGADGAGVVVPVRDAPSQLTYSLLQDTINTNGTDNSDNGITNTANAELAIKKNPIVVPSFTVDGGKVPYSTDYSIGDIVQLKINNFPSIGSVNGLYRIEGRTIEVNENDSETVQLKVVAA